MKRLEYERRIILKLDSHLCHVEVQPSRHGDIVNLGAGDTEERAQLIYAAVLTPAEALQVAQALLTFVAKSQEVAK